METGSRLNKGRIGISIIGEPPSDILHRICQADQLGVPSYWLTTGGAGPDALTLFAAAATRTANIRLGTSIVPTFPRHPLVVIQQAQVVENLAPRRLILGVGPSHQPTIEHSFGIPFQRPLEHLREYVTVLRNGLHQGTVDFTGRRIQAHARVPHPAAVPIMISALRASSFRLAGGVADGAIAWLCPAHYLHNLALPALREAAQQANRPAPALVAHAYIALSTDRAKVTSIALQDLNRYVRLPFYQQMFVSAGYPEATEGQWSEAMLNAVLIQGSESAVGDGLLRFLREAGADQMIASVLPMGDLRAHDEAALRLIASL